MDGSSFGSSATKFDSLFIESLLSRLRVSQHQRPSSAVKSLEDMLLSDLLLNLPESGSDSEDEDPVTSKTQLAKEESKLEKEIIRTILSGDMEKLKPNSGKAVSFGEHHICLGFQEDVKSGYRVWEWHGHIMLFDEEDGFTPEYTYGNYFERVDPNGMKVDKRNTRNVGGDKNVEDVGSGENPASTGLKELIGGKDLSSERIVHRNLTAKPCSTSFT